MGENTKISWATHTFNPVWGCVKVSPRCDNCYNKGGDRLNGIEYKNIPTPIDHINKLIACEEQSHGT